jgi:hypothetical protein
MITSNDNINDNTKYGTRENDNIKMITFADREK